MRQMLSEEDLRMMFRDYVCEEDHREGATVYFTNGLTAEIVQHSQERIQAGSVYWSSLLAIMEEYGKPKLQRNRELIRSLAEKTEHSLSSFTHYEQDFLFGEERTPLGSGWPFFLPLLESASRMNNDLLNGYPLGTSLIFAELDQGKLSHPEAQEVRELMALRHIDRYLARRMRLIGKTIHADALEHLFEEYRRVILQEEYSHVRSLEAMEIELSLELRKSYRNRKLQELQSIVLQRSEEALEYVKSKKLRSFASLDERKRRRAELKKLRALIRRLMKDSSTAAATKVAPSGNMDAGNHPKIA